MMYLSFFFSIFFETSGPTYHDLTHGHISNKENSCYQLPDSEIPFKRPLMLSFFTSADRVTWRDFLERQAMKGISN